MTQLSALEFAATEKRLREHFQTLTEAAAEVRELWGQIEQAGGRVAVADYPFDEDFDKITSGLIHIRERLTVIPPESRQGVPVFDYDNQAWVVGGKYIRCGHLDPCDCYGRAHEGEPAKAVR